jgi:cytochrome P450
MTHTETPVVYPFSEAVGLTLDPHYARLRQRQAVPRVSVPYGADAWLVTGYHDIQTVLSDQRFSRQAAVVRYDEARLTPLPVRTSILGMDPPDHSRLRRLIAPAFTERRIEALRSQVVDVTETLLDTMIGRGSPADLAEDFAIPLSGMVICALLGVPFADRVRFRDWTDAFASTTALRVDEIKTKYRSMYEYMSELLARRRQSPTDDVIGSLVRAMDDSGRLDEHELVELASVLLVAGHDTTASQLTSSMYLLLADPGRVALLRQRPELLPTALEELLRYVPLISRVTFARCAVEDVELSGTLIRAGDMVLPAMPSANRDEAVFQDAEQLDLERKHNPHIAFGYGAHRCVGASLARLELQVAINALLTRLPAMRLDPAQTPAWRAGVQVRGLARLPVVW